MVAYYIVLLLQAVQCEPTFLSTVSIEALIYIVTRIYQMVYKDELNYLIKANPNLSWSNLFS